MPNVKKRNRSFSKSIRQRKKFYKPQRAQPWKKFTPEPGVKGRRRVLRSSVDLVKLGGVGRALTISGVQGALSKTKFKKGSQKRLIVRGHATDKKGKRIKDRPFKIEVALDKGRPRQVLLNEALKKMKAQAAAFGWKVSSEARRNRKLKGQSVRSLKVEFELVEES